MKLEWLERLRSGFWLAVLAFHGVGAAAWWWLMPGGFPVEHPRFWVNGVLPPIVLAGVIAARVAVWKQRPEFLRLFVAGLAGLWLAAAVSSRWAFPITMARLWLLVLAAAGALAVSLFVPRPGGRMKWWAAGPVVLLAAAIGAWLPFTQRAPMADTRPLNVAMPEPAGEKAVAFRSMHLTPEVDLQEDSVTCAFGALNVHVSPSLTFQSRSPDGCWVLLARREMRVGPERKLVGIAPIAGGLEFGYRDDDCSVLRAAVDRSSSIVQIEAFSSLRAPVYSHLNTYCELAIIGHKQLFLEFSPCARTPVEIRPSDYPFGRPRRLAYLDAAGVFHVAEASSGEKGPFRDLASGPLARSEPLAVTLLDEDRPVCRVVWEDFAAQAATALSPTAGWGLPMNAIEFTLSSNAPASMASMFVTLASTSVGRGFDSVGHGPGVYRNRMRVEPVQTRPAEERRSEK